MSITYIKLGEIHQIIFGKVKLIGFRLTGNNLQIFKQYIINLNLLSMLELN